MYVCICCFMFLHVYSCVCMFSDTQQLFDPRVLRTGSGANDVRPGSIVNHRFADYVKFEHWYIRNGAYRENPSLEYGPVPQDFTNP